MPPKYESTFTQRVIEAIENARLDAGVSVQELIERSGIRRSSYFRKMRGDTTFTTEDVDALSQALGLDPMMVFRSASEPHAAPVSLADRRKNVGGEREDGERIDSDERAAAFEGKKLKRRRDDSEFLDS